MIDMRIAVLAALVLTPACAASGARPQPPSRAASIEYQLPVTTAKLNVDLVLVSCTGGRPVAVPTVTVAAISNPAPDPSQRFRLYGANLSSFSKNRQVAVELYPNGAMKSINGGVADRTGAIIASVLKIGAGLVGFAAPPPPNTPKAEGPCNDATVAALSQVDALTARIKTLRSQLPGMAVQSGEATRITIDALAAEIARLRGADGQLHLTLAREIGFRRGFPQGSTRANAPIPAAALADTRGGAVRWKPEELAKWIVVPPNATDSDLFSVGFCVRPAGGFEGDAVGCGAAMAEAEQANETASSGSGVFVQTPACYATDPVASCARTLVFREPVAATLVVVSTAAGSLRDKPRDAKLARQDLSISQWGDVSELALTVGFGGNFTMAAGFDEFGRRTSFTWKADSRGEAIAGAASGIVDAANAFRGALTTDLEAQQAEISRLETQQKLNKLEFCRQVIEAGGFTCPAG